MENKKIQSPKPGHLSRRAFFGSSLLGLAGLGLPAVSRAQSPQAATIEASVVPLSNLINDLLIEWCDGMVTSQIDSPEDPTRHGALHCSSCDFIHGRCMDAVYPLFTAAKITGNKKYVKAGIKAFEWSHNVSQEDGSWTVIANPKSWRGISVFGAISLAETLHYHSDLLDDDRREKWTQRLREAAEYIHRTFSIDFTNINYGSTGIYALHLIGHLLHEDKYLEHSRKMAGEVKRFITKPSGLLWGEGKPIDRLSDKGLPPVDLGYNVEESLAAMALYAVDSGDSEFSEWIQEILSNHLEFMLPDGGWDNSWGTRQAKWTYWGSRTCDGSQPGYGVFAKNNPSFASAVRRNTELMKRCTYHGLLYGGPQYLENGAKPCIHHTFTHAKCLAELVNRKLFEKEQIPTGKLPRSHAYGLKAFPEIETWLVSHGKWRATVTAYDFMYNSSSVYHPTGGVISMLWHESMGPLLAGSMPDYVQVERNNMQFDPNGLDDALTPRIEYRKGDLWYTQLYDLKAQVAVKENRDSSIFDVNCRLCSSTQTIPAEGDVSATLRYHFDAQGIQIDISTASEGVKMTDFVFPVIASLKDGLKQVSERQILIEKENGNLLLECSSAITITPGKERIFNLVPGFGAFNLVVPVPTNASEPISLMLKS